MSTYTGTSSIGFKEFLRVRLIQPLSHIIKEIVGSIFFVLETIGGYVKSLIKDIFFAFKYRGRCVKSYTDIPAEGRCESVARRKYYATIIVDGLYGSLNTNVSSDVSKIPHLKERFERVLGF